METEKYKITNTIALEELHKRFVFEDKQLEYNVVKAMENYAKRINETETNVSQNRFSKEDIEKILLSFSSIAPTPFIDEKLVNKLLQSLSPVTETQK